MGKWHCFLLALTLVFLPLANADEVRLPKSDAPEEWQNQVCEKYNAKACAAAQALHWFRTQNVAFQTGTETMAAAGAVGTLAFAARLVVGNTPTVEFMFTFSKAGVLAGGLLIAGGAITALVLTTIEVSIHMISPAGDYYDDKPDIAVQCYGVNLNQFKTPEGLQRLFTMSPEEKKRIALCLPEDESLFNFLKQAADSGEQARNQAIPST